VNNQFVNEKKPWIFLLFCSISFLTACGSDSKSSVESTPTVAVTNPPLNNWSLVTEKIDDFGDGQVIFENVKLNSSSKKLSLVVACTGGLFELWTETNFYLPDRSNGAVAIKVDGGERRTWSLDKRAEAGGGVFAVRFKNGQKLFEELITSKSLSVKLDAGGSTFQSATFDLEGIGELPKKLSTAGCN
jgi:hypothetical protein